MFFDDTEREKHGSMLYHAFRIFECDDVSRGRLMKENCVRPLAQRRNYGSLYSAGKWISCIFILEEPSEYSAFNLGGRL